MKPELGNQPIFIADHLALDFLNTVLTMNGELVDVLEDDEDVLRWLRRSGWAAEADLSKLRPGSLLRGARALRDVVRVLVERRKAGKRTDPADLNDFLAQARSWLALTAEKNGAITLGRKWKARSAEEMLAPIAELAADLLAHGDFELIRRCESDACVLWFYDRTKSHQRRWCSMAACGNRHKVAEYRKRQQEMN